MFERRGIRIDLILLFLLGVVLSGAAVLAQDPDAQAQKAREAAQESLARAREQQRSEELRKERERFSDELGKAHVDGAGPDAVTAARDAADQRREKIRLDRLDQLRQALKDFQGATAELSEALGFKAPLKEPARKMEKSAAHFLDLIKSTSKESSSFDSSEFKGITPSELGWETLTTAERLAPELAVVILTQRDRIVDARSFASLPKLRAELLRLQWMTQRLK